MSTSTKRPRGTLAKLDSVIAEIEQYYELTINHQSCANIAKCGFRGDNLTLAIAATDLLFDEQPISLRGLLYRVVSAGWLPSTDHKHYTRLGRMMTRLREARVVPFSWIVDGVRSTDKPSSWSGLADYARSVRDCYRLNFWASLPHYVHIIVEKDAIAGTLSPVTQEFDVALSPIRGYSSLSFAHEIASTWNQIDKPVFCYYLGDFDPSGFDLQRDIRDKLARYCDKPWWYEDDEPHEARPNCVIFRRLGVLESDFKDFDLRPLAIKKNDTRSSKFRKEHGNRCAELDAIPATELRRRVREAIEFHITNRDEWERLQKVEAAERETLDKFVAGLEGDA
jgi:hypothetical protein